MWQEVVLVAVRANVPVETSSTNGSLFTSSYSKEQRWYKCIEKVAHWSLKKNLSLLYQ